MTPIVAGVVAWLKAKLPASKAFPAPNDRFSVRSGTDQHEIYFVTNADEAAP
jgi:hypothetical protein